MTEVFIDGNPLPRSPKLQYNLILQYSIPVSDGEFYANADYNYRDESNLFLHETVERHSDLTGSQVAARLLDAWPVEVDRFRKVMPIDYKRVLTVMAESRAEGLSEEQTVDRVMEAARG